MVLTLNIGHLLSIVRLRLSRINAYLEVKIWSLFKEENLTLGNKILWERGEIAPNFSVFPQYFQYISNFWSQITYSFVKCGRSIYSNYFFLSSANLICRGTDISKYFRESRGLRDNKSRLYYHIYSKYRDNWMSGSVDPDPDQTDRPWQKVYTQMWCRKLWRQIWV